MKTTYRLTAIIEEPLRGLQRVVGLLARNRAAVSQLGFFESRLTAVVYCESGEADRLSRQLENIIELSDVQIQEEYHEEHEIRQDTRDGGDARGILAGARPQDPEGRDDRRLGLWGAGTGPIA